MNRAIRNKTDEYFCHSKSNKNAMLSFAVYMVLKTHIKSEKNLKKYLRYKNGKENAIFAYVSRGLIYGNAWNRKAKNEN